MKRSIYVALCAMIALAACRNEQWDEHNAITEPSATISLLEALEANPECATFVQALKATGYDTLLTRANSFTVFAPVNSAWAKVNMNNKTTLQRIVGNLIATDKRLTASFAGVPIPLVNGKFIHYDSVTQTLNGAMVTSGDNVAANGIFHLTDKIVTRFDNVWNRILSITDQSHSIYINNLTHRQMDVEHSVQIGYDKGLPVYDTAWIDVNPFLDIAPLNDESKVWTYVVLSDAGFEALYNKYRPYFKTPTVEGTDNAASLNVCQDFIFEGRVDITQVDSAVNIFGMKVPFGASVQVLNTYEASNGIVYVIDQSNIPLREKIRPVVVEGESFTAASDPTFVYARYKLWASGERDVILSCGTVQTDSVPVRDSLGNITSYKAESKTFNTTGSAEASRAITSNFFIELKAQINSGVDYEVHYVAFDDVGGFSSDTNHVLRIEQKLFMSLPGQPLLKKGTADGAADAVANNCLGDTICFVGINRAGNIAAGNTPQLTRLGIWSLQPKTQFLKTQLKAAENSMVKAPIAGEMTMWLCNTTRRNTSKQQGMMFLDYVKLIPVLPNE